MNKRTFIKSCALGAAATVVPIKATKPVVHKFPMIDGSKLTLEDLQAIVKLMQEDEVILDVVDITEHE